MKTVMEKKITKKKPVRKKTTSKRAILLSPYRKISNNDKPSEVTDRYWLEAFRKKGHYRNKTVNSGKWLVFVKVEELDETWERIKKATEDGKLGDRSKTGTMKPNPHAKSRAKVICVYTYDWTDKADVKRIREGLRKLGITGKIPYKADEDTFSGKYAIRGDTKIAKYFE